MIDGKKINTCKKNFFVGFKDPQMIKSTIFKKKITINKRMNIEFKK
jgi:hypothetical protein